MLKTVLPLSRWIAIAVFAISTGVACAGTLDRVIAKLNEDILTESDLREIVAEKSGEFDSKQVKLKITPETLGALFDRTLLLQAARKENISVPDSEVQRHVEERITELRAQYPSEGAFKNYLAERHISLQQLKKDLMKRASDDFKLYQAVAKRFLVTDADAERYDAEQTRSGKQPLSFHLYRLAVPIEGSSDAARSKARARLNEVVRQLQSKPVSFPEALRNFCESSDGEVFGSDMGFLDAGSLSPEVRKATQSLKPGEATPPMIVGESASVFYLEAKRGARSQLFEKKFSEERQALLRDLRARAHLQVYDNRLLPSIPKEYASRIESGIAGAPATPTQESATPTPRQGLIRGTFGSKSSN